MFSPTETSLCRGKKEISRAVLTSEVKEPQPETTLSYLRPSGRNTGGRARKDKVLEPRWLTALFMNVASSPQFVCLLRFDM